MGSYRLTSLDEGWPNLAILLDLFNSEIGLVAETTYDYRYRYRCTNAGMF